MSDSSLDSLPCILLPLQDHYLLLPNAAVLSISSMHELSLPINKPEFWLGECKWESQSIPVIDLESLIEETKPDMEDIKKLCIVRSINADNNISAYAFIAHGSSQLIQINQSALQLTEQQKDSNFLVCQIKIGNKVAYLPNLDNIEMMIHRQE